MRRLAHILIACVVGLLFMGCDIYSNDVVDDGMQQDGMRVTFAISSGNPEFSQSRASSYGSPSLENGTEWENYINLNGKDYLFYLFDEEGFAYNSSEGFSGSQKFYNVRCVRNLGVNGDTNYSEGYHDESNVSNSLSKLLNNFDEPQPYVQVDEATRTMDLTYLNDESKRGFVNTELTAEHTEHSDENQLYNKFQWADGAVTASRGTPYSSTSTSYRRFSGDEVAYGERNNPSMRTLTRASLYPNDVKNTVQPASDSPRQGWRAPNQKELMLLHFHANGFRAGTTHTCTNADGGTTHSSFDGDDWFFCRTTFSFGGMKANRDWRDWTSNWLTDATSIAYGHGAIQNDGNWYRYDKTNRCPGNLTGTSPLFYDYRYAFGIQHNGTGFGLLFLDYYMQNNTTTKYCYLIPVRDVN